MNKSQFTDYRLKFIKNSFTLAEVLITLGIIGVVVAMTVPVIMAQIQERQFREAAKAAYSKASQVVQQMKTDNGSDLSMSYGTYGSNFASDFMGYFKIIQDCGQYVCFSATATDLYNSLCGAPMANNSIFQGSQFIDATGCLWGISWSSVTGAFGKDIVIDVNGYTKGPNVLGRDVYGFSIKGEKLTPMGAAGAHYDTVSGPSYCAKGYVRASQGFGCMEYVMQGTDYSF